MKRRNILVGMGGLAAGGGLFVGTGAFSSVRAERTVSVETAQDSDALLKLDALGGPYRSKSGGQIAFTFPSLEESEFDSVNSQNPEGLGRDSVYWFGREAENNEDGLFRVKNQGTQEVSVWGSQPRDTADGDELPDVDIFEVDSRKVLTEDNKSDSLSAGNSLLAGIRIDTHGVEVRDSPYEFEITIHAAVDGE